MLRVVLVIDDYNELIYLETVLKKLGFDVEGLQNPRKYFDVSLGFNPHIVMLSARGKKVDGLQLAQGIQRRRGLPKLIALVPTDQRLTPDEVEASEIDQVVDTPINPRKLILALATVGDLDEQALIEKYQKIKGTTPLEPAGTPVVLDDNGQPTVPIEVIRSELKKLEPTSSQTESPGTGESPDAPAETVEISPSVILEMPDEVQTQKRREQHQEWLSKTGIKATGEHFLRDRIHEFNKKIRSASPSEDIEEVEDERKRFVKSLFDRDRR